MTKARDEKEPPTPTYTGLEPELSSGLTGHEPLLGGKLREWPSIVAHLFADQMDALRAGDHGRLRVIRQLRARIWDEAFETSLVAWERANQAQGGEHLSVWRASRIDTEIDTVAKLQGYERPVYDKIRDDIALRALRLELEETRASLAEAQAGDYSSWEVHYREVIDIIEAYIARWEIVK
ncbi:MAG: hypothetical protein JXB47_04215 [Anaerolineae bacterium]|nr:hypothetical protein [Anaerolineae bacterium]